MAKVKIWAAEPWGWDFEWWNMVLGGAWITAWPPFGLRDAARAEHLNSAE